MRLYLRFPLCILLIIGYFFTAQAQFVNFEETWGEFLNNDKTSNISKLPKPSKDQTENWARYCLMYANNYFCTDDLFSSENMMDAIKKVGKEKYDLIPGFTTKHDLLASKIVAYKAVDKLWRRFLRSHDVTLEELKIENAAKVCEKGTLAKYFYMIAYAHYCNNDLAKAKENFENRLVKLGERTSFNYSDVDGLEAEVKLMKELFLGLKKLEVSWKEYIDSDVSPGFDVKLPEMKCYSIPSMKAYVLRAAADLCTKGAKMLKKIHRLQSSNTYPLDNDLKEKIAWLEKNVSENNGDLAKLNKAWKEFLPKDTLTSGIKYDMEYCQKDAQVKAYIMDGMMNICTRGLEMLEKIAALRKEHNPRLDEVTVGKIKKFGAKLQQQAKDQVALLETWNTFIDNKDTLLAGHDLRTFYCDKIAQTKAWTIKGHLNPCSAQKYLTAIDKLKKKYSLNYDSELACRVLRLRGKVYQCRYIELVLQARKETHEERERFGPQSAKIMEGDLNSNQLPCPTTVKYFPLGNIGIKYIISTFLCQEIDLAKMGDPEYYKKIASWVDEEVLQKYCEVSMRCKEDFYIYLEGHTDGHPFRGARYKKSLDIPENTPYTHYLGAEIFERTTEREITTTLKSNMELGIARAWTVKQQLDFMGVPITIGAYEHPKYEKGGEYRRIEIELNINNLLLDFYEKRLKELIISSGIGERPKSC